jgi:hypothetical protein
MTQQVDPMERASQFLHRQGEKGLDELEGLMRQTSEDWERCLDGMTEAQATHQPEPTEHIPTPASGEGPKWCVKETIGHYLLSERSLNNTAAGLAGVPPPHDSAVQVRAMGEQSPEHEAMPLDGLRQKLADFFGETTELIGRLGTSSKLDEKFPHPVFGPLNIKEWLAFHRLHAMDHIQQIERIKNDAGYPKA